MDRQKKARVRRRLRIEKQRPEIKNEDRNVKRGPKTGDL